MTNTTGVEQHTTITVKLGMHIIISTLTTKRIGRAHNYIAISKRIQSCTPTLYLQQVLTQNES